MDLLNLDDKQFSQTQRDSFVDLDLYTPDPAKGQQGVYKAVGRFLPWWKDTNNSKLRKNVAVLTNPLTKDKLFLDCPSTIPGRPSVFWALDKLLKDRENNNIDVEMVKEIRMYFSRFLNFYSPFYVFTDPQMPTLQNQIKIINFGITLDKLIQKELNPEDADINPMAKKVNPYSLVAGKDFLVVIKKKSKRFKDYDGCKFLPEIVPFRFIDEKGEKHVVTIEELQKTATDENTPIGKFLRENTPNLEKYAYREWTEENYKQVASFLKAIIPYPGLMRELIDNTRDEKMKQLLIDGINQHAGNQSSTPVAQAQQAPQYSQPVQTYVAPAQQAPVQQAPVQQAPQYSQPDQTYAAPVQQGVDLMGGISNEVQSAPPGAPGVKLNEDDEFARMLKSL